MRVFENYWKSIGKPKLEVLLGPKWHICTGNPRLGYQYRILNDPNWDVRKKWIDSEFELPLEARYGEDGYWVSVAFMLPTLSKEIEYRVRV
jgi:hypothetical protein